MEASGQMEHLMSQTSQVVHKFNYGGHVSHESLMGGTHGEPPVQISEGTLGSASVYSRFGAPTDRPMSAGAASGTTTVGGHSTMVFSKPTRAVAS